MGKYISAAIVVICVLFTEHLAHAQKASGNAKSNSNEENILNFRNWPDYLPRELLKDFEKETGIHVNYSLYENNEELQKLVERRGDADDLVVPGISYAKSQRLKGLYRPLNLESLTNHKNIDPQLLGAMSDADPGNKYFVPWAWGYTTLFINRAKITNLLAGAGNATAGKNPQSTLKYPENEWELVFNPVYTNRLKQCGIAMLDSPSEIMPLALHYIGKNPYSQNESDYSAAAKMLKEVRADVRTFSNQLIDVMTSGNYCVGIAWSGDIKSAIEAMKEQGKAEVLEGLQPKTGATRFVDVLAIPKNAKHPKNAHAFINFYLSATQGAKMPNEIGYPNGNIPSLEYVNEEAKKNPLVFPSESFSEKLVTPDEYSVKARWAMMYAYMAFAFKLDVK